MSAVFGSYISFQRTILDSLCTFSSSTPFFNPGSRTSVNGHALVANADEVVAELLDSVGSNTGLHDLWVVGDEDGLGGLDDDNTLLALWYC